MQASRTSEKLTLLVLAAVLATWLGGRQLLERADALRPRVVAAAGDSPSTTTSPAAEAGTPEATAGVEQGAESTDDAAGSATADAAAAAQAETLQPSGPAPEADTSTGAVRVRGAVTAREERVRAHLSFRPLGSRGDEELRAVEAQADVGFAVTLTRAGRHLVHVTPVGFLDEVGAKGLELLVDVPSETVARVALELPGGRLSGRLENADGEAVEDAFLELIPIGGSFGGRAGEPAKRRSLSDEDGRFRFDYLAPGDYAVCTTADATSLTSDADESSPTRLYVTSDVTSVPPNGDASLTLRLPRPAVTPLVVVQAEGLPAYGAKVYLRRTDTPGLPAREIGTTGRDGLLLLPVLAASDAYSVHARSANSASPPAALVAGEESVQLTLEPARSILVHTVDAVGQPLVAQVEVVAADAARTPWARSTPLDLALQAARPSEGTARAADDLSRHHLGPFLLGEYTLRAWTESGLELTQEITLERGDAAFEQELRLIGKE